MTYSAQNRHIFGYSDICHVSGYPIHIYDLFHQKQIYTSERGYIVLGSWHNDREMSFSYLEYTNTVFENCDDFQSEIRYTTMQFFVEDSK